MLRAATATMLAILVMATATDVGRAAAQTLADPNAKPIPPPPASAKSQPSGRTKACSGFGAGFVQIPGTDACIKIGGAVQTEATGAGR